MQENTYSKTADFVLDDSFSKYVNQGVDPNMYWAIFIKENPQLSNEIEAAKKLVLHLSAANDFSVNVNKQEELEKLLRKIEKSSKSIFLTTTWMKYAAAVALLIASIFVFDLQNVLLYEEYTACIANSDIQLADGTLIDLRKGSTLQVSRLYDILNRTVQLEGEAFFKVHRNENSKFIAELNTSQVTVLGTSFNIRALPDSTFVAVTEGRVAFKSKVVKSEIILTKNMSAFGTPTSSIQSKEFDLNQLGWSTGEFQFNNQKLPIILQQLGTYYPVHFIVNEKYNNKKLSFYVADMSIDEVLKLLDQIVPEIQIERNNDIISIQ